MTLQLNYSNDKKVLIYLGCVFVSVIEMLGLYLVREQLDVMLFPAFLMAGMAMLFGIYFWFFMKERLPAYYDENRINVYVDGIVHMNMTGVYFNNHNWPYIVKAFRIWSLAEMTVFPLLYTLIAALFSDRFPMIGLGVMLFFSLGGLFVPAYVLGRKYQYAEGEQAEKQDTGWRKFVLCVLPLVLLVLFFSFGEIGTMRSVLIVGGSDRASKESWSGEYSFIDGFMQRNLWTVEETSGFQLVVAKEEGQIGFEIKDTNGTLIFEEENMESGTYEIDAVGKCAVRVIFEEYKGAFYIGE